jgi:hypothetical protein
LATVRGSAQLAFDAFAGLTNTVEQMHETIARRPLPWTPRSSALTPDRTSRAHGLIAATVYTLIRGAIRGCAKGVDLALGALPPPGTAAAMASCEVDTLGEVHTLGQIRKLAALNGVFGDHLEATGNPLAIGMGPIENGSVIETTPAGLAAAYPDAGPHIVVLAHGLCLSELAWTRKGSPAIGERLREALGMTPVYLRYNSGRHISANGRDLADLLERLCASWPVPVESLSLLGHSMGGLVIRSACWYGKEAGRPWLRVLRRVACLGTPHHGSPVERAGHAFERSLRRIQYVEPLLLLGQRRSAGIKDLRHGNLRDEDWQGHGPDQATYDRRNAVPLPAGIDHFFAAASVGRHQRDPRGHLFGDWLVHSDSAVGDHADARKKLPVPPEHCRVFHEKSHLDLLSDTEVHAQVIDWFTGG